LKIRPVLGRENAEQTSVLLVRDGAEYWSELRAALEAQSLRVCEARRFSEAAKCLAGPEPPQLVFTSVLLADGDWERVLVIGKQARVPVIVVSTCLDARFCLDVLQEGAFDFIVPPFECEDVDYLVRNVDLRTTPGTPWHAPRAA
jgi:DNA-binding NtrC family response regulator